MPAPNASPADDHATAAPARPRWRPFGSISAKIAFTTVLLVFLVIVAFLGIVVRTIQNLGRSEADARAAAVELALQRLGASLARNTASASEAAVLDSNFTYLQAIVERAAAGEPSLRFVQVLDENGRVIADSRRAPGVGTSPTVKDALRDRVRASKQGVVSSGPSPDEPDLRLFAAPIVAPPNAPGERTAAAHLGELRVGMSMEGMRRERAATLAAGRRSVEEAVRLMAIAAIALLLLGISIAVTQGLRLSRPLSHLAEQASRIAGGDLDQRVPVTGATEIAHLSAKFNFMAGRIHALLEEARFKAAVEKELEVARVVQDALVPGEALLREGDLCLAAHYRPAALCGGDWWTVRRLSEDRVLIAIGDVTGHGLPAALIMAAALGCCEAQPADADAEAVLRSINAAVLRAGQRRFFMSCFAAVIDRRRGVIRFANAGHTFPFIARREHGAWQLGSLAVSGSLLGNERELHLTTGEQPLHVGDLICCFSDGLTERRSATGEQWGERRLLAALKRQLTASAGEGGHAATLRDRVIAEMDAFAGDETPVDDLMLVITEVTAAASGGERSQAPAAA